MKNPLVEAFLPTPDDRRVNGGVNFRQGVVTSISELGVFIQLDGDENPLPSAVPSLIDQHWVGARVLVLIQNRRAIIMGALGGIEDTGWVDVDFVNDFTTYSGNTTGVRRVGNRVFWRGLAGKVGGGSLPTSQQTLANVPEQFRPVNNQWFTGGTSSGHNPDTLVVAGTSGIIQYRPSPGASPYVGLGNLVYLTD